MDKCQIERFWSGVDRRGPDECWPWKRSGDKDGYGKFYAGAHLRAHRVSWELANGRQASGLICHTCDNPPCCNPAHLFEGTPLYNMRDKHVRARQVYLARDSHPMAKLSETQVSVIRARLSSGERGIDLAREFGLSEAQISRIKNGKRWVDDRIPSASGS